MCIRDRVLGEAAPPAIAVDVNGCQLVEVLIPKSALCCRFVPYRRRLGETPKRGSRFSVLTREITPLQRIGFRRRRVVCR